jgi:hypothetical protein
MDLGFETIGNATLICHDRGPLLATDPWIEGPAYFGSWVTSHEIPPEQRANVEACKYLWISHGHPDHLSPASLERLRSATILLPDHVGGRAARELGAQGYRVRVLPDGVWTELGPRTRVCSIADFQQDAILLVDLDGKLVVNTNDASDHGAGGFVRAEVAKRGTSFLLCLTGYGDADMVNFYDEEGRFLAPPAMRHEPFLDGIEAILAAFRIRYFVPFSSLHKYQRTDSAWANACTTPVEAYAGRFASPEHELLPPFCRFDLARMEASAIDPPRRPDVLVAPEAFGDSWSDELEPADVERLRRYFARFEHLRSFLGFVRFVVGGKEHVIDVAPHEHRRGISFATTRASLMTAIEHEVFDDVLIGNFARTTLHGDWHAQGTEALYPDFAPFLGKYGDNGGAHTAAELGAYFAEYRRRGFLAFRDTAATPADLARIRATRRSLERYGARV